MNINWKVRMKNPWFWVGLFGVIFTAMGIEPNMLTSWGAVKDALMALGGNPFMLGSVVCAVLGVFVDPTTARVGDSKEALTYISPKKD